MRNRYRTEEYAINNGDYRTSSPQMDGDEIAQIKAYVDQQDQLIVAQHNADKETQESRDTEQDNQIFQNATDIGINQVSIANLTSKNTEQDARLDALESRPVGMGSNLTANVLLQEIVIEDGTEQIVFDGLDAIVDGGYIFTIDTTTTTTTDHEYSIFLNDDKTSGNYVRVYNGTLANTASNGTADNSILVNTPIGGTSFLRGEVTSSGKVITHSVRSDKSAYNMDVYTKTPLANVTKIELGTDAPTPIGTRISLYKRKTEIKPSLVQEVILDADATSIVFDNLDALADGGYEMIINCGIGTQLSNILLFINDETTYNRTFISNWNGSSDGLGSDSDDINGIITIDVGQKGFLKLNISYDGMIFNECIETTKAYLSSGIYTTNRIDNTIKLELRADITNGIPAGTKASLYRRKFNVVTSPEIKTNETPEPPTGVSYQLGDIILQNSEWTNDFVEINGMTFVKCNRTVVEGSSYPFIADCNLAVPVSIAKKPINMTSANTPVPYVVTSRSSQGTNGAANWKAFNGIENEYGWRSDTVSSAGGAQWIAIDLGYDSHVTGYDINHWADGWNGFSPTSWEFQGSSDGINWTTVHSLNAQPAFADTGETRHYDLSETAVFRHFRLSVSDVSDINEVLIGEISLWVSGTYETPTLYITDPETTQNIYYYMRIK